MMAAISEAQRRVMHLALVAEFGEEVGDTIMAHLPPVGWADVATKGDLVREVTGLRQEIGHTREVLEARIDQSRSELRGEISELRGEISELRGELLGEIGRLRGDMGKQTWRFVGVTLAAVVAVSGLPQVIGGL